MKARIPSFLVGLIFGAALTGVAVWQLMPSMMLTDHASRLGFDETVAAIGKAAVDRGWKVPKVYDIQKSLRDAGHDMTRVKILSICQPTHAHRILEDDANKKVTAIMPCRIGVYETADGTVRIAEMNIGLMSRMFGGVIEEVMGEVAEQEKEMLASIIVE